MGEGQALFVLKLRRNIALEGDLVLARLELEALTGCQVQDVPAMAKMADRWPALLVPHGLTAPDAYCRREGQQGYAVRGPLRLLKTLITRASFLQAIYCLPTNPSRCRSSVPKLAAELGPVLRWFPAEEAGVLYAVPHYLLLELSAVVVRRARLSAEIQRELVLLLAALLAETEDPAALRFAETALATRTTTSHLAHDLHYYKAKFFPRMARALVNVCAERTALDTPRVLDNFAGSGTTLLESAMLGFASVGIDLDPLSVLITSAKLDTLSVSSDTLLNEAAAFVRLRLTNAAARAPSAVEPAVGTQAAIAFPTWLLRNRKMTAQLAVELGGEMAAMRARIEQCSPELRDLMRVLFSDAIARKVRLRFLGTGVGRFSLAVRKTPLEELVLRGIERCAAGAAAREWLEATLRLRPATAEAHVADARHMPADLGTFDVVVTSPPYLPASSGRESYTKGRAPSLIALGLRDHLTVDALVEESVGSMDGADMDTDAAELTAAQEALVAWLRNDSLRSIKADPTARYFLDMRRAFAEMRRVLAPGARAAVVSGKTSTFYQFATRNPLYVAPVAEMLADEAQRAGLLVEGMHDIQLHKTNRNARPRSLDAYFETLIMLRQPD